MRIELYRPNDTVLTVTQSPIVFRGWGIQREHGWYISQDGIQGLLGSPSPKTNLTEYSNRDGAYISVGTHHLLPQNSRVVSIDCWTRSHSAIETAQRLDALLGYVGYADLILRVEEASKTYEIRNCYISDDLAPRFSNSERDVNVTLTLTCPNGTKYGASREYEITPDAKFEIENNGNAFMYPEIAIYGNNITDTQITVWNFEGWQTGHVRWRKNKSDTIPANLLTINTLDGTWRVTGNANQGNLYSLTFYIDSGVNKIQLSGDGVQRAIIKSYTAWK